MFGPSKLKSSGPLFCNYTEGVPSMKLAGQTLLILANPIPPFSSSSNQLFFNMWQQSIHFFVMVLGTKEGDLQRSASSPPFSVTWNRLCHRPQPPNSRLQKINSSPLEALNPVTFHKAEATRGGETVPVGHGRRLPSLWSKYFQCESLNHYLWAIFVANSHLGSWIHYF